LQYRFDTDHQCDRQTDEHNCDSIYSRLQLSHTKLVIVLSGMVKQWTSSPSNMWGRLNPLMPTVAILVRLWPV